MPAWEAEGRKQRFSTGGGQGDATREGDLEMLGSGLFLPRTVPRKGDFSCAKHPTASPEKHCAEVSD